MRARLQRAIRMRATRTGATSRREGGFVLITSVLLLLLISATVVNTIDFSGEEFQSGGRARSSATNLYAADAGIQLGLTRLTQPRDLSGFSYSLTDGTLVESRARDETAVKDIEPLGMGKPPDGYSIEIGKGFVNELFSIQVTAVAANAAVTELESKMASLQPNSGG